MKNKISNIFFKDNPITEKDMDNIAACQEYISKINPFLFEVFEKKIAKDINIKETALDQLAKIDSFNLEIREVVNARAEIIDTFIHKLWNTIFNFEEQKIALVAVGGYGRKELHPYSDIDLLILLEKKETKHEKKSIEHFIRSLWDIGLSVGQSVRTLSELEHYAKHDHTIITNLMESRIIAGNTVLFGTIQKIINIENMWKTDEYFLVKYNAQKERHLRYGDTGYQLEPNIKKSPGGLRDIQIISWVTKRHYQDESLKSLVKAGFLTADEYDLLEAGKSFLWYVRFATHMFAKTHEDHLRFDLQQQIAPLFGYTDSSQSLAVEQFMQAYYRVNMQLNRLNEMLLQNFHEEVLEKNKKTPIKIDDNFQIRNEYLETKNENVFLNNPSCLLEVFLIMQNDPQIKGVRAPTIRNIRKHTYLINDSFRKNTRNKSIFMQILKNTHSVARELKRMHRYGVLSSYWPSFAKVVGKMQYDLFHVYTVDEHTLRVLQNVRNISKSVNQENYIYQNELFKQIPKPELLYIAALFHDVAKGRGEDHSQLGGAEAEKFCLEHDMSEYDATLVKWLVENHLVMSLTVQRKDISNPEIIRNFAEKMGNSTRLIYLYLLTVADIQGTNPELWTGWRDSLLKDLLGASLRSLRRGLNKPPEINDLVKQVQNSVIKTLDAKIDTKQYKNFWKDFDDDYFIRHTDDELAWHVQAIFSTDPANKTERLNIPFVFVRDKTERGCTEILVYQKKREELFTIIAYTLSQLNLNILDVRVITSKKNRAVDTFLVLDNEGLPIQDSFKIEEIKDTIEKNIKNPHRDSLETSRLTPSKHKHFSTQTQINFIQLHEQNKTQMELRASDHPGLLFEVLRALKDSKIFIQNARITTIGERVDDIFTITDKDKKPITDPVFLDQIENTVKSYISVLH
ncbi:MAG: [protein-PII] uridylyltransferase [Pseudomonadota bacterium]